MRDSLGEGIEYDLLYLTRGQRGFREKNLSSLKVNPESGPLSKLCDASEMINLIANLVYEHIVIKLVRMQ